MTRQLLSAFSGYYGMGNFGDDLFGAICTSSAARFWGSSATLVGPAIAGVSAKYTMPRWFPITAYGSSGLPGQVSRVYSFLRAAYGPTDLLVLGGGSVIHSRKSFRQPIMISAKRRCGLMLAAVGISIGPFDSAESKQAAADFLANFSYIAVRDRRSFELATEMGLGHITALGRDLAGLLAYMPEAAPEHRPYVDAGPRRLGIALCNYRVGPEYAAPDPIRFLGNLEACVVPLARARGLEVAIFSLNQHPRHGDMELSLALERALRKESVPTQAHFYNDKGPLEMVRRIGECDAFVSARLHGALGAYMQGVPFAIVDYHPKCRDFADDIGLPSVLRITSDRHSDLASAVEVLLGRELTPAVSAERYGEEALDLFRQSPWWRS
ncbi:polysaccharide pyruvyl transferase family protein [Vulgatibacter sp.]|uniref:polysaccharide pyruvyl transferase family protein n=1 Tax=Vulgatibacter sp. TaxID=1971226 RepID=UPI00356684AC